MLSALILASAEGAWKLKSFAKNSPEKIHKEPVDITKGLLPFQARDLVYRLGLKDDRAKEVIKVVWNLYEAFNAYDAELAEINPLFITKSGEVIAGDGKFVIDDTMLHAHPDYKLTREHFDSDAEYEAALDGIPYLQFDGRF